MRNRTQNLPKGWRKVKLGDYINPIRGVSYSSADLRESENSIYLINLKNVDRGGGFRREGLKIYAGKHKKEQLADEGDIIIAMTDLTPQAEVVGMPALVPKLDRKACISMDIVKVEFKKKGLDKSFLYYLLNTRSYKGWIRGFASGVNVLHLDSNGIIEYEVEIPSDINEQKRIASILSAFDEKIELNNKINETLEKMAQAIFKHWFVDFKFPGHEKAKFVDSELGKIPEGWEVEKLGKVVDFQNGYTFKSSNMSERGAAGVVKIKNVKGRVLDLFDLEYIDDNVFSEIDPKYILSEGDILIAMTGYVGEVSLVPKTTKPLLLNQRVGKFIVGDDLIKSFLYFYLKQPQIKRIFENAARGSAQPNLSTKYIKSHKMILPSRDVMSQYAKFSSKIIKRLLDSFMENNKLSKGRDTLLPKLMSGEIRV